MSKKIIGVTVGTTLPKPNFEQTDPTRGDYIRNKPDFEGLKSKVENIKNLVGDTAVSEQINAAIANIDYPEEIYVQNDAPTNVEEGTLWLDMDEESIDIEDIYSYIDDAISDAYEKGTKISSGANLNDYNAIGKYYANANSVAASLTNCPTTQNFVMWVFIRTDSVPSQVIIDLTGKMFIRSRTSTTWRTWQTYLTDANVTSIVTEELAKRIQLYPEFANNVEECTNTNKIYVLPDGFIYAYMGHEKEVSRFTNQIKNAIDTDGTPYNGGKGYKTGWRFNSSKQEVEADGNLITGYIPYTPGQVIRISGYNTSDMPNGYFHACNSDFSVPAPVQVQQGYGSEPGYSYGEDPTAPGTYVLTIDPAKVNDQYLGPVLRESAAYIRVNISGYNESALKITLDEEIVVSTNKVPNFTNQLPLLTDADGSLYNGGKGWKADTRLSSSGVEKSQTGMECTGFIPVKLGDVIYLDNMVCDSASSTTDVMQYSYFCVYDKDKNFLSSGTVGYFDSSNGGVVFDPETLAENGLQGNVVQINTANLVYPYAGATPDLRYEGMAFFRISCEEITDASIITVNEPIEYIEEKKEIVYEWTNTGHAFVPADYEDRIIAIEETAESNTAELATQKEQIAALANGGTTIPDYVVTEAESVIDRVITAQGDRTFTFAAITDMHYGVWSYTDGIAHACQALKYIDERLKLDAVAVLGDYTDNWVESGNDADIADFKTVNTVLDSLRFAPNLRLAGNHDIYNDNPALTMRYINAYSDDVVWGSRADGYYYKDFDGYKIRVIGLNTSMLTTEQYNWFASALDLSDKEDIADWSILVLSHHPLDWMEWNAENPESYCFCHILDGYKKGQSGTVSGTFGGTFGEVHYDFTNGKNAAKLIGNIHGHIHNFKVDYIYMDSPNYGVQSDVLRMATPNACYNRENEYTGVWAEDTKYPKTKNSAKDASFCIYCIDLDACTIKAICYGAGYDREADYSYINDVTPPVKPVMDTETWTFELEDGTTVTKQVVVMV